MGTQRRFGLTAAASLARRSSIGAPSAGAFTPAALPGLVAWFEARDLLNGGTLPADGASVPSWKDKSGLGHDANQATGTRQPVFRLVGQGGQPDLTFTKSVNSVLVTVAFTLNQPDTIYVVGSNDSTATGSQVFVDGNGTNSHLMDNNASLTTFRLSATGGPLLATVSSGALGSAHVLTGQFNGGSSISRIDGAQVATGNAGSGNAGGLAIGGSGAGASINGHISAVIAYNAAHTAPQMAQMEAYLKAAFGTP